MNNLNSLILMFLVLSLFIQLTTKHELVRKPSSSGDGLRNAPTYHIRTSFFDFSFIKNFFNKLNTEQNGT